MTKHDHSDALADWSLWLPFVEAPAAASRLPGVYIAKDSAARVRGHGRRASRSRHPGQAHRLSPRSRRSLWIGRGRDRALRDPDWLRARLQAVEKGADWRARDWATAALERAELKLRWATTATGDAARQLERAVLDALADIDLWNRAR